MIVYVHYYITGQILAICFCHGHCAVSLPCAANHITGNYNYLCSVPPCLVCYIMQQDPFLFLWCSVCLFRTELPPLQNKTLQTQKVFIQGAADLFQIWKVIENYLASFSFHIQAGLAVKTFARDLVFCDMRMM